MKYLCVLQNIKVVRDCVYIYSREEKKILVLIGCISFVWLYFNKM